MTTEPATPFHDLDHYLALPRLSGLKLSPDGSRLITTVATLNPERTRYVTALWQLDPAGARPAIRLTRSAQGESGPAFLPDGSLLFVSARPDPDTKESDAVPGDPPALWHLPVGGGEPRVIATRPGGVGDVVVAATDGTVIFASQTMPSAVTAEDDAHRRKQRKERKVSAILHESYPIRYWDHDLGPDQSRLFSGRVPDPAELDRITPSAGQVALRDLTPRPGRCLDEAEYDVSPDGETVITTWQLPERGGRRASLAAIDVETGARRVLLDDPELEYSSPLISPDGLRVAVQLWTRSSATEPPTLGLGVLDLASGEFNRIAAEWDRWPTPGRWTPDGRALIVTSDSDGRAPVFRIEITGGEVTRLTGDHGCYSDVQVSPDGRTVYALRSAHDCPPLPVRLDATRADQQPEYLPSPTQQTELPGTLTEVFAEAADGTPLRGWLCLPEEASADHPAPLLLWIHGGPLNSASAWSWRWNPWLMVARGYAVLSPDFALSTGYGIDFIRRGWGRWGQEPFTDLMAITDAVEKRPEIDASRTGAMGGSFGGYMANWVAGHTDRFRGIVSHAGLWALDQFGPTTDAYHYWRREMTADMSWANSPHRFVEQIRTPILVIHGDRDYRVPIGEALRLWAELAQQAGAADGAPAHKFLLFPSENHWVLSPEHAKLWYQTVCAFLASTVLGEDWVVPELLA